MKKSNFKLAIKNYLGVLWGRYPWKKEWLGVGMIALVLLISAVLSPTATHGDTIEQVIGEAAEKGDYKLADILYRQYQVLDKGYRVLGENTELEDVVYPEHVIIREIKNTEELLIQRPYYVDALSYLADLYKAQGNVEKEKVVRDEIYWLNPNN